MKISKSPSASWLLAPTLNIAKKKSLLFCGECCINNNSKNFPEKIDYKGLKSA